MLVPITPHRRKGDCFPSRGLSLCNSMVVGWNIFLGGWTHLLQLPLFLGCSEFLHHHLFLQVSKGGGQEEEECIFSSWILGCGQWVQPNMLTFLLFFFVCALPSLTLGVPWPGAVQGPPGAVPASFGPLPFGAGPGPGHL